MAQPLTEFVRLHFDHYMKLLDLFETRQTWTFNFAVGVYAIAIPAAGFLVDKAALALKGGVSDETDVIVGLAALTFSIALPLLMLSLGSLFVDVSVYCAALNVGSNNFYRKFTAGGLPLELNDPAFEAYQWMGEQKMDLRSIAKRRHLLFFLAPIFGVVVGGMGLLLYSARYGRLWPLVTLVPGAVTSFISLWFTWCAYRTDQRARTAAEKDLKEGSPSGNAMTATGGR
jgi:hypothetical protein